jgi:hypothetical protein
MDRDKKAPEPSRNASRGGVGGVVSCYIKSESADRTTWTSHAAT